MLGLLPGKIDLVVDYSNFDGNGDGAVDISDAVRGHLDGHIVLSRNLAQRAHYPAVDVLASLSRLADKVCGPTLRQAGARLRRRLAIYRDAEDLISVGAYVKGSNPQIDEAVEKLPALNRFLVQAVEERYSLNDTLRALGELAGLEIPEEELGSEAVSVSPRAAARA